MRSHLDVDQGHVATLVDDIYGAALQPDRWPGVLAGLARLYGSAFADISTRSRDGQHIRGLAHGLDVADYEGGLLGSWRNRNVWRDRAPAAKAGEVASTRSLLDAETLRRSEIYADYLHPRDLHEGLRFCLSADEEVSVVSVLRPWSAGAFEAGEVALGRALLPHLQRAAAVTRRLDDARFEAEVEFRDGLALVAFDAGGKPVWFNAAGDAALASCDLIGLRGGSLLASSPAATAEIERAVARAVGQIGPLRSGTVVQLRAPGRDGLQTLSVLPVSRTATWCRGRPPAAIAFLHQPPSRVHCRVRLADMFGLTAAETEVALKILDGGTPRTIAQQLGRSVNTVRTHLYRLMDKTGTDRQTNLLRILKDAVDMRLN